MIILFALSLVVAIISICWKFQVSTIDSRRIITKKHNRCSVIFPVFCVTFNLKFSKFQKMSSSIHKTYTIC